MSKLDDILVDVQMSSVTASARSKATEEIKELFLELMSDSVTNALGDTVDMNKLTAKVEAL